MSKIKGFKWESKDRIVCWVSCGAPSAVAGKMAQEKYRDTHKVVFCYQDTGSEHPDNKRFIKDLENWYKQEIIQLKSNKYANIHEVFRARKYISGVAGAPCTGELKRKPAENFLIWGSDVEIFGYTEDEVHRVQNFRNNNPERKIETILIDKMMTKEDCKAILQQKGIELPAMYKLGYHNNNCIGCVKGQSGYWNKIREDFPEVFQKTAKLEREIGAAINKRYEGDTRIRVFLDELDPEAGNYKREVSPQCGILCYMESEKLENTL